MAEENITQEFRLKKLEKIKKIISLEKYAKMN